MRLFTLLLSSPTSPTHLPSSPRLSPLIACLFSLPRSPSCLFPSPLSGFPSLFSTLSYLSLFSPYSPRLSAISSPNFHLPCLLSPLSSLSTLLPPLLASLFSLPPPSPFSLLCSLVSLPSPPFSVHFSPLSVPSSLLRGVVPFVSDRF